MAKVLVIDDSAFIRRLLRSALETAGHEVMEFLPLSALEVVEKVKDWSPDLVLTDFNMPEITGDQVVKMARRASPQLRVIVLTSLRDSKVEENLKKLGANRILHKPMAPEEIMRIVGEVLAARPGE